MDAETQKGIPGAQVYIPVKNEIIETDTKGHFNLQSIADVEFDLVIFVHGYDVVKAKVSSRKSR